MSDLTLAAEPATGKATESAADVGIDSADQQHAWTMRTADGKIQRGEVDQTPEAIQEWVAGWERRFGGWPVAVAVEQARGALITLLGKYAHVVVFPIPPNALDSYRKVFTPSGAKRDPRDADLILELLVCHQDRLRRFEPDTVETRKLQFLSEERRGLVNQHTSQKQRLIHRLKQIFPQALDWFDDPACAMVCELLGQWPTLQDLQKVSPKALRKFFHRHNCRDAQRIEKCHLSRVGQLLDPVLLLGPGAL